MKKQAIWIIAHAYIHTGIQKAYVFKASVWLRHICTNVERVKGHIEPEAADSLILTMEQPVRQLFHRERCSPHRVMGQLRGSPLLKVGPADYVRLIFAGHRQKILCTHTAR
jgi:hypothetical protein